MFTSFFLDLKKAGVPVTLREYLTLMEAMDADLAEKNGYLLAAPMGYNTRGWYGAFGQDEFWLVPDRWRLVAGAKGIG